MMMSFFEGVKSVEEAKSLYRKLSKELHPDLGGDEEEFKKLSNDFEKFIKCFMADAFASWENESGREAKGSPVIFSEVLKSIIDLNIRIEIIGYWIYAFDSFAVKDILNEKGFWFSGKHKAWVYNGSEKNKNRRSNMGLDRIKDLYGCEIIRNKDELKSIPCLA